MRLFVAVYPPPAVRDHLAVLLPTLAVGRPAAPGRSLRLAPPEHWHLTLAFLGEVPDDEAAGGGVPGGGVPGGVPGRRAAERALAEAAGEASPAVIRLAGGGRFGSGRFTVLWVGVAGELDTLTATARAVRRRLKQARVPFDAKPFRAHLTLARPGDRLSREEVDGDVQALRGYEGPQWTVTEVCLVRSHLGPRPEYDRLATFPLSG